MHRCVDAVFNYNEQTESETKTIQYSYIKAYGWMDGWMYGWMDGWMDGWSIILLQQLSIVDYE